MPLPSHIPAEVTAAYDADAATVAALTAGLINRTFLLTRATDRVVLQCLNPLFGPEVNDDLDHVTTHLAARGVLTPRLVRTRHGQSHVLDEQGHCWRAITYVEGHTHLRVETPALAEAAGHRLGTWHAALADYAAPFAHTRGPSHDTPAVLDRLERTLEELRDHVARPELEPVAQAILARGRALGTLWRFAPAVVHGDPKISNFLFSPRGDALCLVDLDTFTRMPRAAELGDALRSWGNARAEDDPEAHVDVEVLRAALSGYARAARHLWTTEEVDGLAHAGELIALELAARFATDTLRESYFGWDATRFGAAWQHHLQRARAQLALARSFASHTAMAQIAKDTFLA